KIIALAGNPNVGKSTVFNALTGMKQHTGNWPGKTVTSATGEYSTDLYDYIIVDVPGTYSLFAHSAEEEVARNFICFGDSDLTLIVCDATCLERNLNLVLQILEISKKVVVCVNLLDEAKRKGITVDLEKLTEILGVPVVGTVARKKKTLIDLKRTIDKAVKNEITTAKRIEYPEILEEAILAVEDAIKNSVPTKISSRWLALKLLDYDDSLANEINAYLGRNLLAEEHIVSAISEAFERLKQHGIERSDIKSIITPSIFKEAETIAQTVTNTKSENSRLFDRKIDKIVTSKIFGFPLMFFMLCFIFWLTIVGANYPSTILSSLFLWLGEKFSSFLIYLSTPQWLHSLIINGVYKVLSSVTAVMLPPMAIFFPLFTLLEDIGYLPRIAYNLDRPFKCCKACGKQSLTMCMGFGCNAAGVVGCRIIDSPRERLIAILTNSFVPCNGRFPIFITLTTIFFISSGGFVGSLVSALFLTAFILLGFAMTFAASHLLSITVLKGVPSSFVLELPPYRKPQIGKVIVRSVLDRTLFVLGRAVAVAAPAGIVIWLAANVYVGESSILTLCSKFLDPFARLIGLDGVILVAFILGFPANEIVLPIIIMAYLAEGTLVEFNSLTEMKELFIQNGWTLKTAICTMIFSLFHWPCSTTMLTIKKETGSLKWTAVSMLLPTIIGMSLCFIVANII
ncbi:MAG: ferrous iron transport protein B, partial [Clostridia bacterium]|nr:ferrous iron transport protein B [Clostridia bacterium]